MSPADTLFENRACASWEKCEMVKNKKRVDGSIFESWEEEREGLPTTPTKKVAIHIPSRNAFFFFYSYHTSGLAR